MFIIYLVLFNNELYNNDVYIFFLGRILDYWFLDEKNFLVFNIDNYIKIFIN